MKLLFCPLVVNALAGCRWKLDFDDFNYCTDIQRDPRHLRLNRYACCTAVINHFKYECGELNAQPLPHGYKHKEWVNKKWPVIKNDAN